MLRELSLLIVICLAAYFAFRPRLQKREDRGSGADSHARRHEKRIDDSIRIIAGDFAHRALGYQLTCLARTRRLSAAETDHLFAKYPKITICPHVEWTREFAYLEEYYALLEGRIRSFLDGEGYRGDPEFRETDRFENFLVEAALHEAEGILQGVRFPV